MSNDDFKQRAREEAEKQAELSIECTCDPAHPFYDCGTCFYHWSTTEQFVYAHGRGAEWGRSDEQLRNLGRKNENVEWAMKQVVDLRAQLAAKDAKP
jgi:hypothetical protein